MEITEQIKNGKQWQEDLKKPAKEFWEELKEK